MGERKQDVEGAVPYRMVCEIDDVFYCTFFIDRTKHTKFGLYRGYCLIANLSSGYKIKSPVGGAHANLKKCSCEFKKVLMRNKKRRDIPWRDLYILRKALVRWTDRG